MLRIIFAVLCVCSILVGIEFASNAKSAIHEILYVLVFMNATLCLIGFAVSGKEKAP